MSLELALMLYSQGNYKDALAILEQDKGTSYKHLFLKGLCFLKLGRPGDAKISLEKAVSLETEPEIYYYLGLVELHLRNPKKALAHLKKVKPPSADSLLLSALASFVLKKKEDALAYINKALELNPAKVSLFLNVLSEGQYLPAEGADDLLVLLSEGVEVLRKKKG